MVFDKLSAFPTKKDSFRHHKNAMLKGCEKMIVCVSIKRIFRNVCVAVAVVIAVLCATFTNLAIVRKNGGDIAQNVGAQTQNTRSLPIYSVATDEKKIAISFDCAWGVDHTDSLLKIMEQNDVRCTFFAVQFWVEKYPEYVEKIINAGHEMGTHSRTHSYMSKLSKEEIIDELRNSSTAIEKITGKKVTLFRPPYGDYDDLLIDTAKELGLYTIQWDVDSLDWKNLSGAEIAMRVINGTKNGSIILCHNNGLHTAESLSLIFSTLKNRGYQFVPISELIYKENYYVDHTGKQHQNI